MKGRLTLAVVTTIGLLAATGETGASEKLALRVTPNVSNAPSTVVVRAIVAQDSGNRWLHVEADSGAFYRSSSVQLDGDKAPTVTEILLKSLPSGEYTVTAKLKNAMGEETIARRTALVLSRFGEP
ncbi:MAG TPA: hypothetical protein VNT81_17920 [Vicinamibacterales bacterium]|nr:hypothetical protein [Vicinamibacterales bacterium]